MKIIFVLFSIIVFHHDVIGQSYFSNISRPPFALTSFSNKNFLYQNDTLITFSHCFEVKENLLYENSYLTHFNADGKLMRADNIGHLFVNERMIKDGNKIIVAGSHAEELDDGKMYRNFDSIMIFQYEDILNWLIIMINTSCIIQTFMKVILGHKESLNHTSIG